MGWLSGMLQRSVSDDTMINTIGQRIVFDAANNYLAMVNEDMNDVFSVFVEGMTEEYKERYKLPGGGRLSLRSSHTDSPAYSQYGEWDVAYPLNEWGGQIAATNRDLSYMTAQEFEMHVETLNRANINTVRNRILSRLLDNTQTSFTDKRKGSLSIEPLANGDTVVYPPVIGSEAEATDDHYLVSGYTAANINDTNNPFVTMRAEIEEHFGKNSGGSNIVVWFNSAQRAKIEALTTFYPVYDQYLNVGTATTQPNGLPRVPGVVRGRVDGVWAVEWDFVPAKYLLGVHLEFPKPLKMRVDPAITGLQRGFHLASDSDKYPLQQYHYEHNFGIGCANRLNGVGMFLDSGSTWTVPTGYSF